MSVGVLELDDNHRKLLAVINELEGCTAGEETFRRSLNWLLRYAQTYFAREQEVMRSYQYSILSGHIDEQRHFLYWMWMAVASFNDDWARPTAETRDALITYLEDWWRHHILAEDRKYKRFVEQTLFRSSRAAKEVRGYGIW